MSSQAVGFQVQGDVIGGASLVYSATGRLLKALNNDGVDFYAVSASVQLGKLLPLSQEREAAICQLLEQRRTSRESYLSKALRIGWGHSYIPHELARNRAGVSALNIIGVFATGCRPFESAKALSSLMQMYGCEADSLPSLDSLSTMIDFLSPFVTNSTFDAVIANIRLGCTRVLKNHHLRAPDALDTRGDSTQWARIVKHLMATSTALEHAHIAVGQRGVWLATFAAHTLGMSVSLYFTNVILWEAAGTNGSVTLYLYDDPAMSRLLTQSLSTDIQLEWLEPSTFFDPEPSMLLLEQLFESGMAWVMEAELSNEGDLIRFDNIMSDDVREAICRFSEDLFDSLTMQPNNNARDIKWPINGHWPLRKQPLQNTLRYLGVLSASRARSATHSSKRSKVPQFPTDITVFEHLRRLTSSTGSELVFRASSHLGHDTTAKMSRLCGRSESSRFQGQICLCCRITLFILRMSGLAVALAQCTYDQSTIRIGERILRDDYIPIWLRNASTCDLDSLLAYLVQILDRHGIGDPDGFDSRLVLAWSKGGIVIYNRTLFDSECFDNYGRFLAITSGQISCNGLRRNLVFDGGYWIEKDMPIEGACNTFDVNTEITPFLPKGPNTHRTMIDMESTTVNVWIELFQLADAEDRHAILPISLTQCIVHMLANCTIIGGKCNHKSQQTYIVRQAHSPVIVHTLGEVYHTLDLSTAPTLVFAVAGSPLNQTLQAALLGRSGYCFALQGASCLDCIITAAKKDPQVEAVLMS